MTNPILINFGGFVPLSTVDWRGRSVCVIFFRGCPVRCWYCHNSGILEGCDKRDVDEVLRMVRESSLLISGVVFSGGEATMQPAALFHLARAIKNMGLKTGLHTNGVYPEVIRTLIEEGLIDLIALDSKPEWNLNTVKGKEKTLFLEVMRSLDICTSGFHNGKLPEFEIVLTLFPGSGEQVDNIATKIADDVDLVLQQGEFTGVRSLTLSDLTAIANQLSRPVRIRMREQGEIYYEGTRDSGNAGIR
jgi:pyruvate formate lyase activating enzyme